MKLLVLLIGGNNIANYALIKYFQKNGGIKIDKFDKVVLVYTSAKFTLKAVENIKSLIDDVDYIDIKLENETHIDSVKNDIDNVLSKINITGLHLNYTGGRKPMSIGAFLYAKTLEDKGIKVVYSYISPSNYKLTLLDGSIYPEEGSVSDDVHLTINELFLLHNNEKPYYKSKLSQFYSEEFIEFLIKKNIEYRKGNRNFYSDIWDKSYKELKKLDWQSSVGQFVDINSISDEGLLKELQSFIRGEFLEEYVFSILIELKDELNLSDIGWNVKNGETSKFEIDLMGVKGYKPFIISCTTAYKKSMVKGKIFEAIYRAEQIGGIRTTPISISFANDKTIQELKDEDLVTKNDKAITELIGVEYLKDRDRFKERLKILIGTI